MNCGWAGLPNDKASNHDVNDFALEFGPDPLAELLNRTKALAIPEPRFKPLNGGDLHALPAIQWCIRGVLPATGVCALYGPSASGKSFLGFDMAAATADDSRWFGFRVQTAPVVYTALEGKASFRLRAGAWEAHNERKLSDALQMLLEPFKLTDADDVQELAAIWLLVLRC